MSHSGSGGSRTPRTRDDFLHCTTYGKFQVQLNLLIAKTLNQCKLTMIVDCLYCLSLVWIKIACKFIALSPFEFNEQFVPNQCFTDSYSVHATWDCIPASSLRKLRWAGIKRRMEVMGSVSATDDTYCLPTRKLRQPMPRSFIFEGQTAVWNKINQRNTKSREVPRYRLPVLSRYYYTKSSTIMLSLMNYLQTRSQIKLVAMYTVT